MVEQHREEEKNFLNNSRMTAASENGHEAMQEIGGYFRETYDNAKKAWDSVDEMTDEEWEDYEVHNSQATYSSRWLTKARR